MTQPVFPRVRAGLWTARAIVVARSQVRRREVPDISLPAPPRVGERGNGAVIGVVSGLRCRCLVRSLVVQRWHAGNGVRRDLFVGVTAPSRGFEAHAWLEDEEQPDTKTFTTLLRRSPTDREYVPPRA